MSQSEVATIGRALRALEYLAEESLNVSELSRWLGVDRGTAARLFATLEGAGYVKRAESGGRYEISAAKIVSLYGMVEGRAELSHMARPILAELRDQADESANLGVLADDEIIVLAVQRSRAMLSASTRVGQRLGLHCSSLGKAFAAFMPPQQLTDALNRKGMVACTLRTSTSPSSLRKHLERVRHLGYAVNDEESAYEVRGVAAPVRSRSGRVIASLGIVGPSARVTPERVHELSTLVIDAAARLSAAAGWARA